MARFTDKEKKEILEKWKKRDENQTKKSFCSTNKLSPSTLNRWLNEELLMGGETYLTRYSIWLPSNKDVFGFDKWKNAPLNILSVIIGESSFEEVLSTYIKKRINEISLNYTYVNNSSDDEKFEYSRNLKFKIYQNENKIGIFEIFSNGLYLWSFNKKYDKDEFYERHLKILFDIEHANDFLKQNINLNLDKYQGILNYFQIELLFNGLYDTNIPPSNYFGSDKKDDIAKKFSLSNILKSILLIHNNQDISTETNRETYKCTDSETYHCIFASSMEQFVRVTNSFSLKHYMRGLDYCLKQLSMHGMLRSYNETNKIINFLPDSLNNLNSSISSLESYQTLIFEKLPLIEYFHQLTYGLSTTIDENKKYTQKLRQAIRQYGRRLRVINSYFKNIEDSLAIENQKNILKELSEIRKYTEINNEMTNNSVTSIQENIVKENQQNINTIMLWVGIWTLVVTLVSPLISYSASSNEHGLVDAWHNLGIDQIITHPYFWAIVVLIVVLRWLANKIYHKSKDLNKNIYSRHIFDNSNPLKLKKDRDNDENTNDGKFLSIMAFFNEENYLTEIPSIIETQKSVSCIKFDTIQERFTTYKKYTFSFYSDEENGIKYILHIDIHYDFYKSKNQCNTSIEDIRVVILKNTSNSLAYKTIHANAKTIKEKIYNDFISREGKQGNAS